MSYEHFFKSGQILKPTHEKKSTKNKFRSKFVGSFDPVCSHSTGFSGVRGVSLTSINGWVDRLWVVNGGRVTDRLLGLKNMLFGVSRKLFNNLS